MGWYFTYGASRKDIIEELAPSQEKPLDGGRIHRVIARFGAGYTQLYVVHEVELPDGTKSRHIGVYLLAKSKEGWGYKPMDEGMHPYFYACPLKYLEMVPEVACQEWRDKVKEYWKQRDEKRKARKALRDSLCPTGKKLLG